MKKYGEKISDIYHLSLELAKANFKLRNEGSYLGILWYLLDPLFMFIIILFIRGRISGGDFSDYPIYLLLGLVMFNFFRQTTTQSVGVIRGNSSFIKSMKIPLESLVVSKIFQSIFSHFFEIVLLVVFMVIFDVSLVGLIFYPFVFLVFFIFILGTSFLFSVIGVYINDLNKIWGVFTRLLLFATPTFYFVRENSLHYFLNLFNPLFYFLTIARDLIIYGKISSLWMVLTILIFSVFMFFIGLFVFKRNKDKFAEHV